ncbi:MAG: NAD(P)/FAD-dependent oxidoreductase [Polyangia bacterium]
MRETSILIVGAGPAGCSAAVQCARLGVRPVLIDRSGAAGGLVAGAWLVENYPGPEHPLRGADFAVRLAEHLARFDVSVERSELARIEPEGDRWIARTERGELRARCALVCTGTEPLPLRVGGLEKTADRVFRGARELLEEFPRPRRAAVIGGGEAAFDGALALAEAGAEVSVLVRADRPRAGGRLAELLSREPRARLRTRCRVRRLEPVAGGAALYVETPAGEELLEVDALLAALGRRAALGRLVPALRGEGGPLPLEPRLGLLVCGDARLGSLGQAGIAVGDGLQAAARAVRLVLGEEERR